MKYRFTTIIYLTMLINIYPIHAAAEPSDNIENGSQAAIEDQNTTKLANSIEAIKKIIADANTSLDRKRKEIENRNYQSANAIKDTDDLIEQLKQLVARFDIKGDMYTALMSTKQDAQKDVNIFSAGSDNPKIQVFIDIAKAQVDRANKLESMASEFVKNAYINIRKFEDNKEIIAINIRLGNRGEALKLFEEGLADATNAMTAANDFAKEASEIDKFPDPDPDPGQ